MNKEEKKQMEDAQAQLEQMRMVVVEQELSARSWKAMRTKMEDTIAISNLQEEYDRVVAANQEKLNQQRKAQQDMMKTMQEAADKAKAENPAQLQEVV